MSHIRSLAPFALSLMVLAGLTSPAWARKPQPFVAATFEKAQAERKTVVLHFFADWCPSCQAQKKILDPMFADDGYLRRVLFLSVPYDDALALRKELKVNRQSTLIVFKGRDEVAREAGVTEKEGLETFFKRHIKQD